MKYELFIPSMEYFFFYGTLLDSEVFSIVLERDPTELFEQTLDIKGFSCFKVLKEKFHKVKEIPIFELGCALGVHTGPGSLVVGIQKIED